MGGATWSAVGLAGLVCGAGLGAQTVDVERVGAGVVSTDRNETFPAEDPVDGSLWFSTYDDSFDDQTVMVAHRTASGWSAPEIAPFSGTWGDRAPRFSLDGSALYFTSNRPGAGAGGDMNIWRVRRSGDGGWTEPEPASSLNSEAADMHVSVTASAIWVASNRPSTAGRSDIYRIAEGSGPEHLPAPVNDARSQPDLWVSPDESWMVLAITDHPDGHGGDDLYVSRRTGTTWSAPHNLGPEINSSDYEYGPTVSADGRYLYFTSHRTGHADIYRVLLTDIQRIR